MMTTNSESIMSRAFARAEAAGCRCTRPDSVVRWLITHPSAWSFGPPQHTSAAGRKRPAFVARRGVELTDEVRDDRRAAADAAFRRRLVARTICTGGRTRRSYRRRSKLNSTLCGALKKFAVGEKT